MIHGYRYGAYGNDFLPSILMSLVICFFYLFLRQKNKNYYFNIILLASSLAFTMKITMSVGLLIVIFIFFKKRNAYQTIPLCLSIILISFFLIKNFINTSCLVYPVTISCIDTVWKPKNDFDFASSKVISERSSSASKDILKDKDFQNDDLLSLYISETINSNYDQYINLTNYQKQNFVFYHENYFYNTKYNWLKSYFKYHFSDQIFPKIITYLLVVFVINILINFFYFDLKKNIKFFFKNLISNKVNIISLFMLFGLVMWFFNAPHLRYGIIYLLYFSILPGILLFNLDMDLSDILKVKRSLKSLLILVLIYCVFKNITMINKNFIKNGYLITENFIENNKFENQKINNILVKFPYQENSCANIEPLCIKYKSAFLSSGYYFFKLLSYTFVTNKLITDQ
jgi:hypothetical protein